MRFAEPEILWGLVLLPLLLLGLLYAERCRRRDLARWFAPGVWPDLSAEISPRRRRLSAFLLLGALFLMLLGAARPQLGSKILETRQRGIDVVLAVDVSLSMEARDLHPSRRERARHEVLALLDRLEGDRVALVSFAGEAFLQSPLTLDRGAIKMLLPLLEPRIIPEPGSNLEAAVRRSVEAFQSDPERGRALVLFTDGEAHEGKLEDAVLLARESGVRVCAVGIGKAEGEPIPLHQREGEAPQYKKDRNGRVVITRLVEEPLQILCQATGGAYVRAGTGSTSEAIYSALRDLQQGDVEGGLGIRYEERFASFAALALLLLLIEGSLGERRRR